MLIPGIEDYKDEVVALRRDFHMHPELGFEEKRTSGIVAKELKRLGFEVLTGFAETAVLGILNTGRPGKTIVIRADMDALALTDTKNVPYKSQNYGVCHACGHDLHTANLLGVAKYLSLHRDEFRGTIKCLFQPAEEGPSPGGGKLVCDSGVLDGADYVFAVHVSGEIDTGELMVRYGSSNASSDEFHIKIVGKGCHGARPNTGHDPIITAVQIVSAFQNIVSRELDPLRNAVISVCSINGGKESATNIIPQEVTLSGTIRAFNGSVRDDILNRIKYIASKICEMNYSICEFRTIDGIPCLTNDDELVSIIEEACIETVGKDKVIRRPDPTMGAEDFACYAMKYKAALFYVGITNAEKGIVLRGHNPDFDVDEDCIPIAMSAFITIIKKLM